MKPAIVIVSVGLLLASCGAETAQTSQPAGVSTQTPAPAPSATPAPSTPLATPTATPARADDALVTFRFMTSFGSCLGYCADTMSFVGQSVFLQSDSNESPDDLIVSEGIIDSTATASLLAAVESLASVDLAEVYGCPDCADGGAASIGLQGSVHTYEFANPPPELAMADELLMTLRESLRTCESSDLVKVAASCTPTDGR